MRTTRCGEAGPVRALQSPVGMPTHQPYEDFAIAAGRAWAEQKAEALEEEIPGPAWPDTWNPDWAGPLDLGPGPVDEHVRAGVLAVANHAAAERWRELVRAQRDLEDVEDDEHESEAQALHLLEVLERDLPPGLQVGHDGGRVYLVDADGTERTVESLEHAWRVVAEYEEHRSLRTS